MLYEFSIYRLLYFHSIMMTLTMCSGFFSHCHYSCSRLSSLITHMQMTRNRYHHLSGATSKTIKTIAATSKPSYYTTNTDDEESSSHLLLQQQSLSEKWMVSRLGRNPLYNYNHPPFIYHEKYSIPTWPKNHTFPMDKFQSIAKAVQTTSFIPSSINDIKIPLVSNENDFFRPWDLETILQQFNENDNKNHPMNWFHSNLIDSNYIRRFINQQLTVEECRMIGFRQYTSLPEVIERTLLEVTGTILTCQLAYQYGIAAHLAGGTHHAHSTGGAGYTILNDIAIASLILLNQYPDTIKRILVIDCDVHQGDGTAKLGQSPLLKDRMNTLSIHCASNYPHPKAHSTYDIGLPDGIHDDEYMIAVQDSITTAINEVQPDFIIYDAGVDIYQYDQLGKFNITENGIRRRDQYIVNTCVIIYEIPIAIVIGGGYDRDVDALGRRHAIVHEEASMIWYQNQMWNRNKITI